MSLLLVIFLILLIQTSEATRQIKNSCQSIWSYHIATYSRNCYYNPDFDDKDVPSMARHHGYQAETHEITTSDGYILPIFRIFPKGAAKKSIFFLQHGMLSNSNHYASANNRSLAFKLADLGFEVWLGNFRGSTYGKKHVRLTVDDFEFWEFSYNEKMTDVREQLLHVANVTGKSGSIVYIGHSLGSAVVYIYALKHPEEVRDLLQSTIHLAPAVYMENSRFWATFAPIGIPFLKTLKVLRINALFRHETLFHNSLVMISQIFPVFGKYLTFLIAGFSEEFPTEDLLMIWKKYIICSASINELLQIFQISYTGKFQELDYGKSKNLEIYKSENPPEYDLSKITLPSYIFHGKNDALVDSKDCKRTYNSINSSQKFISSVPKNIEDKNFAFNHLDFMYARDLSKFLYDELMLPIIVNKFT